MSKPRLLIVVPHLSTGGLPAYTLKQVEHFRKDFDLTVLETNDWNYPFEVQKKQIQKLCKYIRINTFATDVWETILNINPHIIYFQEVLEHDDFKRWFPKGLIDLIFAKDRPWKIFITTHGSNTDPRLIKALPDKFILVSKWSEKRFKDHFRSLVPTEVWEYPVEAKVADKRGSQRRLNWDPNKTHVLNVGLFTPGKNQKEIFEVARLLPEVEFHFVGNQSGTFEWYWRPLMDKKPPNCNVYGERSDTDLFYQAADLFYFPSVLELNPLVVKEALGWQLPVLMRRLDTYLDQYDNNPLTIFIDDNIQNTATLIRESMGIFDLEPAPKKTSAKKTSPKKSSAKKPAGKVRKLPRRLTEKEQEVEQVIQEIERNKIYEKFFPIKETDTVVDIGAHVGIFTKRAAGIAKNVYALEPDPMFYDDLVRIDSESDNIRTLQAGIAAETGSSTIKSDGHANSIGSGDVEIDTITFKDFVKKFKLKKIDFLKVDCEGGEYDLFTEDNIDLLKNTLKCDRITGEFHIHNDYHRESIIDVMDFLDNAGYEYIFTDINGGLITRKHLLTRLNYYTEVLFYANTGIRKKAPAVASVASRPTHEVVNVNYINGCYVEIDSSVAAEYLVQWFNQSNDTLVHEAVVNTDGQQKFFHKCLFQYLIPYHVKVMRKDTGKVICDLPFDLTGKNVRLEITSKSLGDTLAWTAYIDEFRKTYKCNVEVTTFYNYLFEGQYPQIKFYEPGSPYTNLHAIYEVGWWYKDNGAYFDFHKNVTDPKGLPMQQAATDILGIPYKELRPKINFKKERRPIKEKYVAIAIHSTLQAKYWNNPAGWQGVVDFLRKQGYKVVMLSNEPKGHNGNPDPKGTIRPTDYDLNNIMNFIHHSEFFIGIGTGLTWLAWALNKKTVLISGFSEGFTEMQDCVRITAPQGKCTGCFNWVRHQHDGDWNWCPRYKNTPKQFECTKGITAADVIKRLVAAKLIK